MDARNELEALAITLRRKGGESLAVGVVDAGVAELDRLRAVEQAARAWTDARVRDGEVTGRSVIPTAQRLLDALAELDRLRAEPERTADLVQQAHSAWTLLSPDQRAAVRRISESVYGVLGQLATHHQITRYR